MVQLRSTSKESLSRIQELCSELELTLRQRKQINHPRIRQMLDNHIRDLKAELIVFGGP